MTFHYSVFLIFEYFAAVYRCFFVCFFFFKQKTAYEMRISDWSSDVCSSDLRLDCDCSGSRSDFSCLRIFRCRTRKMSHIRRSMSDPPSLCLASWLERSRSVGCYGYGGPRSRARQVNEPDPPPNLHVIPDPPDTTNKRQNSNK